MPQVSPSLMLASFGCAALAYLLLLALVAPLRPRTAVSRWFLAANGVTLLWACAVIAMFWRAEWLQAWVAALDALHLAAWVSFIAALAGFGGFAPKGIFRRRASLVVLLLSIVVIVVNAPPFIETIDPKLRFLAVLALPLAGLFGLEQIFRNATYEEQRYLKPLAIGVGVMFAVDIFVYSQSLLFSAIGPWSWALRGFANAGVVPLLIIAAKRQPGWGEDLFVSRQVVYYSTTFLAVGFYLLVMAVGGYFIGASGLAWGAPLQGLFLFLAGGLLGVILFSRALRNRLRVFIAKHFYRNRYDYREEWLRLMQTLGGDASLHSLSKRSIKALADIIDSEQGELWLLDEQRDRFEPRAALLGDVSAATLGADDPMIKFLRAKRWVVDTLESRRDPEKYGNAFAATAYETDGPSIYVPLIHDDKLVGVVRLDRPPGIGDLGFEDHDLLKTAGQQAAIFLIQERDQESLSETRQFEAFSRLTAFLMHDLKNMIAQQELVVGNAKRFRHRPEFVDDAIQTIDSSVKRMRSVLERLQAAGRQERTARVDVGRVVGEVVASCADREPEPVAEVQDRPLLVAIDRDKLAMALTHAVRNSQDATIATGLIVVRAFGADNQVVIEVEDNGAGMDEEFIRNQLFKPFESTKGAKGMGIGAYQIRETLRAAGGDVAVSSERGRGTTVRMALPAVAAQRSSASSPAA